ncbi:FSR family fosmidomycin resistance protein-like MFS transporter [Scopulibacillus darangshiensis]|uniref:FSR family fosmidomycin resistance protein-like MFS transporter n=1 Tax=Scopulibacillus darangshiensis TaxID=442528 RepID=A0A4R2P9M8_9BACL|nr:MFS transporter [Scopulibacillus darangshiensis]TCP31760.1 FSR family fosmidomycin resistance protein-like MFS transporter [Scopulibacillus darangshiensis]
MEAVIKQKKQVKAKKALYSLGTTHFINDLMTTGVVPALLPLYKHAFDLSYTQAGAILMISSITSSVMQPVFGMFTDKRPKTWFLPLGIFLTGLGLAASGYMPSFPLLLVAIAISGLGSGIFHPEASRGAHLAAGNAKGTAQAIFQVGGNFGQAAGPLMMPFFLLATGLNGVGWFALLGLLGSFVIFNILPWYRSSLAESQSKKKARRGQRYIPGLIGLTVVVVLRSWTQIGVAAFLPFFYLQQDIPLKLGDFYTFLFLGAGAVGTFLGGKFSDFISHKWLLFGSMFLTIPFAWILPHVSGVISIIVLLLFGFFVLSSFAVTVVYGQMMLPNNVGLASGLMIGLGVGAGGIGATFMGWISDHYGVDLVFDLFVVIPVIATIITLFLPSEKKLLSRTGA